MGERPQPILTGFAFPSIEFIRCGRGRVTLSFLLLLALFLPATVQAQEENRAGLVVVHGDGSVTQQCIAFAGESISGYELLQQAGLALSVEAGSFGASVCSIGGEGCSYPAESCFCRCQGSPCVYWSYWRLQPDGAWRYQPLGAGNTQVRNGDVEGWRWAEGTVQNAEGPPPATFDAICAPAAHVGVRTGQDAGQPSQDSEAAADEGAGQPSQESAGETEGALSSHEGGQVSTSAASASAQTGQAGAPAVQGDAPAVQGDAAAANEAAPSGDLAAAPALPLTRSLWILGGIVVVPAAVLLFWALLRRGR